MRGVVRVPKWSPPIFGHEYALEWHPNGFVTNDVSVFGEAPDYVVNIMGMVIDRLTGGRVLHWRVSFLATHWWPGERFSISVDSYSLKRALKELERKVRRAHRCIEKAITELECK